jgi:hypothetical protein
MMMRRGEAEAGLSQRQQANSNSNSNSGIDMNRVHLVVCLASKYK